MGDMVKAAPAIPPLAREDVTATVLICTYNRAEYLAQTLDTLAALAPVPFTWDVLVVDNNSTDRTRRVVEDAVEGFPVPLRYLFEPRQGKSNALNTGMAAAAAAIIVFTDDDVHVDREWLNAAVAPLLTRTDIDYTGGPVRPIWMAERPAWLEPNGNLGGTIAVLDHGASAFVFEDEKKVPLGVNMAVRRRLIERIGGFRPDFGRNGKSLIGQEQAEFFYRSRGEGARGLYVPEMVLDHVVPASRLTRRYFRRWWYWKGISHARVHRLHGQTELGIDLRTVPRILGVPRFVFGNVLRRLGGLVKAILSRDDARRTAHALALAYHAGYCRETWRRARIGTDRPVQSSGRRSQSDPPAVLHTTR